MGRTGLLVPFRPLTYQTRPTLTGGPSAFLCPPICVNLMEKRLGRGLDAYLGSPWPSQADTKSAQTLACCGDLGLRRSCCKE